MLRDHDVVVIEFSCVSN